MLETRVTGAGARDDVVQSPPQAGDCHCRLTPVGVTEEALGVCDEDEGMDVSDGKT